MSGGVFILSKFWYNISKMFLRKSKHEVDPDTGVEYNETTEVWVADFGTHELEQELRQEVSKMKPRSEVSFSWVLMSLVLLFFVVISELALYQFGLKLFWTEMTIFWLAWLWRLIVLIIWLAIARLKWLLSTEKIFITTFQIKQQFTIRMR